MTPQTRLYLEHVAALAGLEGDQLDTFFHDMLKKLPAEAPAGKQTEIARASDENEALERFGPPDRLAAQHAPHDQWISRLIVAVGIFF